MTRLEPNSGRFVFAPLIWRLALKMEQVPWSEVAGSAAEAVYVLRAAQRLFRQDIHCVSFDTWLEVEAAGSHVERDELGGVTDVPVPVAVPPSIETVLGAAPVARTVEILSRLAEEAGSAVPVATLTGNATLLARFGGQRAAAETLDYVRRIMLGLARVYCEAGAGALLLLEEEATDFSGLSEFAALFNLAQYYATPVFILCRHPTPPQGIAAVRSAGAHLLTPDYASPDVSALPAPADGGQQGGAWIAMSRWEVDPNTDPNTIQEWRTALRRG
jgi:hypothetical protein